MGDLTDRIVAQACADPPEEALAIMRLSVLDWIACGLAGRTEPVSVKVAEMLAAEGGIGQATCFDGDRRPARAAALYNGTASHALDYDDTHFAHIGHVSVGVLPAALAMAEVKEASVGAFLRAGLAGCEGAIRMGLALGRRHYQTGFHQTATSGAFGATLAASRLVGADSKMLGNALGLASTRAAGLKSQFGTMGKPYNAGLAATTGVEAALLAACGMTSDPDGWDGPQGFIATHHGEPSDQPDGFLMPQVSHKFHACCHGLHAVLEAFALSDTRPDSMTGITVHTHPRWITVCNTPRPQTGLEAKFSYAAVLAFAANGYDTAALQTFSEDILRQPSVQAIIARVTVIPDEGLSEMQSRVTVLSEAGTEQHFFDLDAPQSMVDRETRLRAKAATLISAERADAIWSTLRKTDAPVSTLARLFSE